MSGDTRVIHYVGSLVKRLSLFFFSLVYNDRISSINRNQQDQHIAVDNTVAVIVSPTEPPKLIKFTETQCHHTPFGCRIRCNVFYTREYRESQKIKLDFWKIFRFPLT